MEKNNWHAYEIDPANDPGKETLRERVQRKLVDFLTFIIDDSLAIIDDEDDTVRE